MLTTTNNNKSTAHAVADTSNAVFTSIINNPALTTSSSSLSTVDSSSSTTNSHSNKLQQQQQVASYLKWPKSLDDLIHDELGRKLFSEYLKETRHDNLLILYMILQCLPQCDQEEQLQKMLNCTYTTCIKNKDSINELSKRIKDSLCATLEKCIYDSELFEDTKQELKEILLQNYYLKFLRSKYYLNAVRLFESTTSFSGLYALNNNLDEQFQIILDSVHSTTAATAPTNFTKPNVPPNPKALKSLSKSNSASAASGTSYAIQQMLATSGSTPSTHKSQKTKSKLNDSVTSRNSIKSLKLTNMPPHPYHTESAVVIPVSAQDSEIQSLSSDALTDDNYNNYSMHSGHGVGHRMVANAGQRHKSRNHNDDDSSSAASASQQKAQQKRTTTVGAADRSRSKENAKMKQNARLNKNAELDMPITQIPRTELVPKSKQQPLAETDPHQFAQILSEKLERLLLSEKCDTETKFKKCHDILNISDQQHIRHHHHSQQQQHAVVDTDIDAERMIDEHVNRVFKSSSSNNETPLLSLSCTATTNNLNECMQQLALHQQQQHSPSKLVSIQQRLIKTSNNNGNLSTTHQQSSSFITTLGGGGVGGKLNTSMLNPLNTTASSTQQLFNNTTLPILTGSNNTNQHLFYQLTSTSKEVDIDETNSSALNECNSNKRLNKTAIGLASSTSNSKHLKLNSSTTGIMSSAAQNDHNYDSGVSTRSVASIERVSDWLASSSASTATGTSGSAYNNNNSTLPVQHIQPQHSHSNLTYNQQQLNHSHHHHQHHQQQQQPTQQSSSNIKTTVAYHLPGEDTPYISIYNGDELTLAQFKQLLPTMRQRGCNLRYFFKTISDLLGEDSIVYQEVIDEHSYVPKYNNKVIAKLEKANEH